jgi:hypothetical protein
MSTAFHFSSDSDEALLLFEALSRLHEEGALNSLSEEERSAVWRLSCALEKSLSEPFDARYGQILDRVKESARRRGVLVALTEIEKTSVHNAINEVCHGVDIPDSEFQTRLGCQRADLAAVLKKI